MHRKRSKKNRNSFLRWKNSRKNSAMTDSHFKRKFKGKQKLPQGKPQQYYMGNVTSEWYWSNYRKAFNYWRTSQTWDDWKGLRQDHPEVEDIIKKYLPSTYAMSIVPENVTPCYSHYQAFENSNLHLKTENTGFNHHTNTGDDVLNTESETSSNESDEIQLEMSEEMIEFFKISFQHKLKLQKEKQEKEEKTDLEKKVLEMQSNRSKRNYEMKLLYGEEASKIIGMETALQLSFDKYCDTKSPKYWPNIPLRL